MTTTVQGIGRSTGSWPSMHVTADSYDSSNVLQSTVTITAGLDGSWSHTFAADSGGSYRVVTETDGYSRHVWHISVPAAGGPYRVTDILTGESSIPDGSITTAKLAAGSVTSPLIADGAIVNAGISGSAAISPTKISGTAVITTDSRLSDTRTPTDNTVTSVKIVDGTIADADISASAAIAPSKVSGTALVASGNLSDVVSPATSRANLGVGNTSVIDGAWINVKDHGIKGDGVTDDTAALNALFASLNASTAGHVYFPAGVYLVNQVTAGNVLLLQNKNNCMMSGVGSSSIIRSTTATATDLIRVETCNLFSMREMRIDVRGTTANITNALHATTSSPGTLHMAHFERLYVSGSATYRRMWDIATVSGSPTIYSAMARFAAGDVGGVIYLNFQGGPFTSTVNSVATLSGVLAADITSSITTVTLNAPIAGAPTSGFTVQIDNERMLVTAGGTTTTLTVSRGRGNAFAGAAHTAGAAVTTYSATLADNATATISNATLAGRVQPGGQSVMLNGIAVGTDHPGASNLDIATFTFNHCQVDQAVRAGFVFGNGTAGNNLDHHGYNCSVGESGIGVYMNGAAMSFHGGDMSTNVVDFKRNQICSQELQIHGVRSEGAAMLWESTGAITTPPSVEFSSINVASCNAEDGVVIRHLVSGALLLKNVSLTMNAITGLGVGIFISASGTSGNPCYVIAENVASSGGNTNLLSSGPPTAYRVILTQPRMQSSGGAMIQNTVVGSLFDTRVQLGGGLARGRTTVADTNYTVLISDMVITYTSITAARVLTLPAQGSTLPAGQEFIVKDESGSCSLTNTITITPPAGTIDGASTLVLNSAYAKATVYTNGTNWFTR